MALLFASMEIGRATAFGPDVSLAKESAKHIFGLLDRKPLIEMNEDGTKCPVRLKFRICNSVSTVLIGVVCNTYRRQPCGLFVARLKLACIYEQK